MRGYDTSALEEQLAKAGYARHVIPDEVQAYIVAPSGEMGGLAGPCPVAPKTARAIQATCERAVGAGAQMNFSVM